MNASLRKYYFHILIGIGVFAVSGVVFSFVEAPSQADTTDVQVHNSPPSILTHNVFREGEPVSDGELVIPNIGPSSTQMKVEGTIKDLNGDDITVNALFFRNEMGEGCERMGGGANNCIRAACEVTPTSEDNKKYYSCTADFPFSADNTDSPTSPVEDYTDQWWLVKVEATDGKSRVSDMSSGFELAGMTGLYVPVSFNLGSLAYGQVSEEMPVDVRNYGNTQIDVRVSGHEDFFCTSGEVIPRNTLRFKGLSGTYTSKLPLTEEAQILGGFDLPKASNPDNPPARTIYWQFKSTEPLLPGICTIGGITIAAIAD